MVISDAIKATTPERPCIHRRAWDYPTAQPVIPVKILPTNSPDGCVIYSSAPKDSRRGWQPTAEDLLADDWELARL